MKKTIKVIYNLTKLNIEKDLIYSLNTWFLLFTTFAYSLAFILAYKFVFSEVDTVLGITYKRMFLLILGAQLFWFLHQVFIRKSMQYLADLINTGGLDMFLIKPIHLKRMLMFLEFDQRHVIPSIATVIIIVYELTTYDLSFLQVVLATVFFLNGLAISFFLTLIFACMSFWVGRNDSIFHIFMHVVDITRLHTSFFPPVLKSIFIFVIPAIPIVNPSYQILYGEESIGLLMASLGITIILYVLAEIAWSRGLKQYTSAN